jgi:hypothetical protein
MTSKTTKQAEACLCAEAGLDDDEGSFSDMVS